MLDERMLSAYGRGRLVRVLKTAQSLAENGAAENAECIEALLQEAGDRIAGLRVMTQVAAARSNPVATPAAGDAPDWERAARPIGRPDEGERIEEDEGRLCETPLSVLACGVLSTSGEPVREFRLIPFGQVRVERAIAGADFWFDRDQAEAAVAWFGGLGRKLAIDYEHQSFERLNTRDDGLRPAAGWIAALQVREDGLWASEVEWTARAAELLRSGEYRYFSPVIYWTDETQTELAALGPVALTNDPAMIGVAALAAGRAAIDAEADDESDGPVVATASLRQRLSAAEREVALLRRQLSGQAADAFVERGLFAGKITDATSMDWRAEYLREPAQAEARLGRAPVVLPPGRALALWGRGAVAPLAPAKDVQAGGFEPADLAAFERAQAAGRVRGVEV